MDFTYVDTEEKLLHAAGRWKEEIGVDIECENNLHHYGTYVSIIQISTRYESWIVDVLDEREVAPLKKIFEDTSVLKIFHDTGFDLRMLWHQFGIRPKNIFDTQVAALLLGKKEIGLGPLLRDYFGIEKEEKMQVADWTRRPISTEMMQYAVKDTNYLIQLKDALHKELEEKHRLSWAEEEFRVVENKDLTYEEGTFWQLKGLRLISGRERSILKRLYELREDMAKKVDRPVYFVINTKMLFELAKNPPASVNEWRTMRRVHPVVRNFANLFFREVSLAKNSVVMMPEHERRRHRPDEKIIFEELSLVRDRISGELGIEKHLVMSKDQMEQISATKSLGSLRDWQKDLVRQDTEKILKNQ